MTYKIFITLSWMTRIAKNAISDKTGIYGPSLFTTHTKPYFIEWPRSIALDPIFNMIVKEIVKENDDRNYG